MIYHSFEDMADTIRRNLWKVPQDVGLIVGIPRSGMIAALMVAELMQRRCATLDDLVAGRAMSCGGRGTMMHAGNPRRVLVIDDTVNRGRAMRKARRRLDLLSRVYDISYACVYAEGADARDIVDIFFEDIHRDGETMYLYEWNILHHYDRRMVTTMWDIDGLMCQEPPDERDTAAYEAYLETAVPMVIPSTPIGAVVSYRLEKYRDVTERWLHGHGIEYRDLVMFQADSREQRAALSYPGRWKAHIYKKSEWAQLFVESSHDQAVRIAELSGKPCFCYEDGKLYK